MLSPRMPSSPGPIKGLLLCLVALTLGAGSSPPIPTPESDFLIQTERQEIILPEPTTLNISNPLGDIRARRAKDNQLIVISIIQRFQKHQDDAKTTIQIEKNRGEIKTSYPSALAGSTKSGIKGRIDLTLLVPDGTDLNLQTQSGLIEIKGVKGKLKAESKSGRVRISTAHAVEAHSGSGMVGVTLKAPSQEEPALMSTKTGNIRADFPEKPLPSLLAMTSGTIDSKGLNHGTTAPKEDAEVHRIQVGTKPFIVQTRSEEGDIVLRAQTPGSLR